VKKRLLVVWADVHFYIGEVQKILPPAGTEPIHQFPAEKWVLVGPHKMSSEMAIYNVGVLKYRTPRLNSFLMRSSYEILEVYSKRIKEIRIRLDLIVFLLNLTESLRKSVLGINCPPNFPK